MNHFEFWFSIGSTYTYLTVMRLDKIVQDARVPVKWRPFSVRALMKEMGNSPFIGKPVKEKYMWRDIHRRSHRYGFPFDRTVEYPIAHFDLANRIAVVANNEGWCKEYVQLSYRHWFQDGLVAGDQQNLVKTMRKSGQDLDRILELANSDAIGDEYCEATSEARGNGIFGSPSFIVGGTELFWGDDRLEDAIEFWRNSQ